ncbi:hypothetical protein GCM10009818_32740 [Nakamurella flavida]
MYGVSSGDTMVLYTPTDPLRFGYCALTASHQPLSAGCGPVAPATLLAGADEPPAALPALLAVGVVVEPPHADSSRAAALTPTIAVVIFLAGREFTRLFLRFVAGQGLV